MKRNYKWILATITFISYFAIEAAYAQPFYKWVDDKGATHYTQTPPPQQAVKKVSINTHIPQDSANEIKGLNDQSNKLLKATTDQEKAAEIEKKNTSADTERRNKNSVACKQIKSNLALLQSGQRLRTMDSKGERSYLTEDQKATQINQETAQIKNDCPN
jgi:hypothetical protein